jgi:flagellar biosynthesis protein FliR
MVIGYPIRLIVGLIVLAAMVGTIPEVISTVVDQAIGLGLDLAAAFR